MSAEREFVAHVIDLLSNFGSCEAKRMFGGYGIFHQGLMIGLIAEASLYLKVDAQSKPLFESEASEAFVYYKQNKTFQLSYYTAPEAFFEEVETTLYWAQQAFDAAQRNPRKTKAK